MNEQPTFVILSFEGPDRYTHAGGLGTRVTELATTLSTMGFETHPFFLGDPNLPGRETPEGGQLVLHRWCQWISRYHPNGVYDGEEGKLSDWERSLPPWLEKELLEPRMAAGGSVVVMAEEWHTVSSVLALREILARRGWQDRVHLLWTANNTFSFHRIDWDALKQAATITTVSRYMKHVMWQVGVDPWVVPNGIPEGWLQPPDQADQLNLSLLLRDRLALVKVARWDPDKRWEMAVDAVAEMKRLGLRPLLLARGGVEAHQTKVLARAEEKGLKVALAHWDGAKVGPFAEALRLVLDADLVNLRGYLSPAQRRALFHVADAVLANSGVEPFGLVGLETMAVGGVAFVGCTGEDYVTPGHDAISLQSNDPNEIVHHIIQLYQCREAGFRMRQAARLSAERYTWPAVIHRALLPVLEQLGAYFGDRESIPVDRAVTALGNSTSATPLGAKGRAQADVIAPVTTLRQRNNLYTKREPEYVETTKQADDSYGSIA